jgi:hypothetical protein
MSGSKFYTTKTSAADLERLSFSFPFLKSVTQSLLKQHSGNPDREIAGRHLGIITRRCLFWYPFLSPEVHTQYDIEDMISDVVCTVVKRASRYNPAKGRESTLVWHITENKCRTILGYYNYKKRSACKTIALETLAQMMGGEDSSVGDGWLPASCTIPEQEAVNFRHSREAVERVIQYSSDAVVDIVAKILTGNIGRTSISPAKIREVRKAADRCAATLDDFVTVMRLCQDQKAG